LFQRIQPAFRKVVVCPFLSHTPPFTPFSSAESMRSVQIAGSTQGHLARISDARLVPLLQDTAASVCLRLSVPSTIHLPASLCSPGITPVPRYYGCSDSCLLILGPCAARPPSLAKRQVSPLHSASPSSHSASNHPMPPCRRFFIRHPRTLSVFSRAFQQCQGGAQIFQRDRLIPGFAII